MGLKSGMQISLADLRSHYSWELHNVILASVKCRALPQGEAALLSEGEG